ncbi:OmpH family outer membrane protein [Schleiferia thermophila]|uniref:Periplasmic chaperone for outer membrane proteins Skp n=1 Tax=Schleiferia thermophila TaxID=884107 RepID=A0A369A8L9_9FLAO|nr:OmpH family outer membrane protein [Schleiferia thermophila]RCX04768.1 periplasmic chaperone for outer membrane proteins Skp [Schleiferia thermophila]GCD79703.1 membrane protein [Schleiferia thermophila]
MKNGKLLKFSFIAIFFATIGGLLGQTQRIAIVDTEYILKKIPEYNQAQMELDRLSAQFEGEIEALKSELLALQRTLNAEKVLLTDDMIREREEAIAKKEKQIIDTQRKYFGVEGELFKKRKSLVKPIQDQVYNAIQEVSRQKKFDLVIDRSNALIVLYFSDKIDISDEVLNKLGYR